MASSRLAIAGWAIFHNQRNGGGEKRRVGLNKHEESVRASDSRARLGNEMERRGI